MATREVVVTPDSGLILSSRGAVPFEDQDNSNVTLIGTPPYIDTDDTGSYVAMAPTTSGRQPNWAGFRYGPYPVPAATTGVRVDYMFWVDSAQNDDQTVDLLAQGPSDVMDPTWPFIFGGAEMWAPPYPTPGQWHTVSTPPDWLDRPDWDHEDRTAYDAFLDQLRAGYLWLAVRPSDYDFTLGGRVGMVRLVLLVEGIPPLRQVQRDDGLLRSARRARGGRSRQGSLRQRGYL